MQYYHKLLVCVMLHFELTGPGTLHFHIHRRNLVSISANPISCTRPITLFIQFTSRNWGLLKKGYLQQIRALPFYKDICVMTEKCIHVIFVRDVPLLLSEWWLWVILFLTLNHHRTCRRRLFLQLMILLLDTTGRKGWIWWIASTVNMIFTRYERPVTPQLQFEPTFTFIFITDFLVSIFRSWCCRHGLC